MGMAASQARYLGLTARKTNVEYEGQQINQARTALANQSANTFNELLALEVPTAPSTQDFTTLQYSYEDGTIKETITDMSSLVDDPDGYNYMISHYHYANVYKAIQSKRNNPQIVLDSQAVRDTVSKDNVTYDGDTYTINGQAAEKFNPNIEENRIGYKKIADAYPKFAEVDIDDIFIYKDESNETHFVTKKDLQTAVTGDEDLTDYTIQNGVPAYIGNCELKNYDKTDTTQRTAYEQICKDFPSENIAMIKEEDQATNIFVWENQGKTYFASMQDLINTALSAPDQTTPTENQNKLTLYNAEEVKTKIERRQRAFVDLDESGRPQSIRYEDSTANYALSTETITDENAYQDAMNQYNYDMQVYEKKIADINAKTEKIQQQDRTLELRLRQLDTEQEALQTEMESVKKVIEKNIESTFKTFQ